LHAQAALPELKQAAECRPDSAWAWYQYGDALLGLGRPAEALPALRKAAALAPETALYHYDLGLALFDLEQNEAAIQEFAGIVAGDPRLKSGASNLILSALTNLALGQEKLGQRHEAIETLLPAAETAATILFNLAFLHFRAKRFADALPFALAAYLLRPNNEDIVHQYGAILSELNRPREAIKVLKLATEMEPHCAGAWYDLGLAQARLRHRKAARQCFLKSLELRPECAWSYYDLACLDALEGRRNAAFDNLTQALARGFRNVEHLRRDADLRSLRRDARWKTLIQHLGELEYANN
jgi:tetratricopeptide (TPR) repeat protein